MPSWVLPAETWVLPRGRCLRPERLDIGAALTRVIDMRPLAHRRG